jgi:hypothetical protein
MNDCRLLQNVSLSEKDVAPIPQGCGLQPRRIWPTSSNDFASPLQGCGLRPCIMVPLSSRVASFLCPLSSKDVVSILQECGLSPLRMWGWAPILERCASVLQGCKSFLQGCSLRPPAQWPLLPECSWLGPPFSLVLTNARVGAGGRGQPLHMTIFTDLTYYSPCSQEIPSLTLVLIHTYSQMSFPPQSVLSSPLVSLENDSKSYKNTSYRHPHMLSPILHTQ